ncbi:MAG: hypothetical protein R3349_01105, partial [Geminicoccaceae bacterium]|nr:hypothetical protein [Geminicoccaceae bacterium]
MTGLVPVSAQAHPFEPQRCYTVEGLSLAQIVEHAGLEPAFFPYVQVRLGGEVILRQYWHAVWPREGHLVEVLLVPQGGGGGGKNPLRTLLTIAVVAGALAVSGGALGGALGAAFASGGTGALIAGAGIAIAGQLLVNAIVPVRPPQLGGVNAAEDVSGSRMQFIEGARNQATEWGPVPSVLGRHRVVPLYGAKPFTRISGQDQYLHMLFVWGFGHLDISDLKIGETPLSQFDGVTVQTRNGFAGETPLSIYSNDVEQEDLTVGITNAGGFERRTTATGADEIGVDVTFGQGLVEFTEAGDKQQRSVQISIRYRAVGDVTWLAPSFTETSVNGLQITELADRTRITFRGKSNDPLRFGFLWETGNPVAYEVEMTRATADSTSDRVFDQVTWTALRRIRDDDPINLPVPVARTALRIKATDQLNSIIDEFNGTAALQCPDYDGAAWIVRQTRNPASLFRHVLRTDHAAGLYLDLVRIDNDSLVAWHTFCANEGFEFNLVVDYRDSVYEILRTIAAAGRAVPVFD